MTARSIILASSAALMLQPSDARSQEPPSDTVRPRILAALRAREADLIAFRRGLHRHPELAGAEERTANAVATSAPWAPHRACGSAGGTGSGSRCPEVAIWRRQRTRSGA